MQHLNIQLRFLQIKPQGCIPSLTHKHQQHLIHQSWWEATAKEKKHMKVQKKRKILNFSKGQMKEEVGKKAKLHGEIASEDSQKHSKQTRQLDVLVAI